MFDCYGHWKFLSFRFFSKHIVKGLPLFFLDYGLLKRIPIIHEALPLGLKDPKMNRNEMIMTIAARIYEIMLPVFMSNISLLRFNLRVPQGFWKNLI